MLAITIGLFSLSFVAEGGAVYLLVREARAAARTLRRWHEANPHNNEGGSWGQTMLMSQVVSGLLGAPRSRFMAVVLVAIGLVSGSVANFVSLAI